MKRHLLFVLFLALLMVACDATPVPIADTPTPDPSTAAYPAMSTPNLKMGPRFILHRPISDGDTSVSGMGPANVPVRIVDASLIAGSGGAVVLGNGSIDASGAFVVQVNPPLIKSHLLGIQIGDLTGTSLKYDDFLRGEGYVDRPLVGTLFDSAFVAARP